MTETKNGSKISPQGSIIDRGLLNESLNIDGSVGKVHNLSTSSPYRVSATASAVKNTKPGADLNSSLKASGPRQSAHGGAIVITATPLLAHFNGHEIVVEGRHANLNEKPKSREQQRLKDQLAGQDVKSTAQ